MNTSNQQIIGRIELVNLPEWNFTDLEAKIDTGAFTSSLHCHHLEPFEKEGEPWIRFYMLDPDHEAYNEQMLEMPVFDKREVKSSNGDTELRYFIRTKIEFFRDVYSIEFSLTDRSAMKYPLLIGRKFLKKGPFMVDVTRKNLSKTIKNKDS
ncbi:MAG: ATP-dependent zinc protease [Gracilimonas sp.]|uniref:ATP-dependent zinc protease family protein n=1 Tax=Gracilimonas TaxID=649462 RepID=UPI001B2986EC|nr:RimK/LysX family protein [Gracilimonas sp.]MBO6586408.1 ATP-dependent zinc protease [Gracilimonas sp.]MBO6615065.1 ATP-dependent zinc protease [Gracilimonas sp.]